jgi:hypothetical protein
MYGLRNCIILLAFIWYSEVVVSCNVVIYAFLRYNDYNDDDDDNDDYCCILYII